MEDRWTILTEGNVIRMYRSWTGIETLRAHIVDNKISSFEYNKTNFKTNDTAEITCAFASVMGGYFSVAI